MSKTPVSSSATRTGESSPALAVQTSAYASADGVLGPLIVSGVSVPFAVAVHPSSAIAVASRSAQPLC
jgi:hypothetical protein